LLLLLFLLLPDFVFLLRAEVLENIGLEHRFADGVELRLDLVDVGMEAVGQDFVGRAKLQFGEQPTVANGASDLLGEVFGEAGTHARSAVGVAVLPRDAPVEIELIVEVRQS
jgi:enamine deaminase RidA (YjgF/YER057c/UK114 family)